MRITETKVISLINFTEIFFVNVHINLLLLMIHYGYLLWIYIVDIYLYIVDDVHNFIENIFNKILQFAIL